MSFKTRHPCYFLDSVHFEFNELKWLLLARRLQVLKEMLFFAAAGNFLERGPILYPL